MLWTLEASYFYYAHGPLARIETGQHNIQGTDYFYTLQGWIKGVNSIGLTHTRQDPGRDGYTGYTEEEAQNPTFNRDEYAYALNYYEGDYEARGENHLLGKAFHANEIYSNFKNYEDKVGGVTYNRESLYNGNIAAMATSIRDFGELQSTQSMNYRYDQLHRIAAAHASKWEGIWTTTEGSYNTSYAYDGNGNIQNLYRNNLEATTIDELYYHYDPVKKNRLDVVKDGGTAEGLNNANPYEYKYDQIGNLTQNLEDGIEDIEWNIYGKVEKVSKTNGTLIAYRYDGTGNRILKEVRTTTTIHTNFYLRDASGNVMAIYEDTRPINSPTTNIILKEMPIYGSSRLGQYRPKTDAKKTALGQRIYEFANHLGNVLVTLTDNKVPQTDGTYESVVLSASDYYPFGMAMGERTFSNESYRYGFNGKENDTDFGNDQLIQDYGFRLYCPENARFLSVDPLSPSYPWYTPYQFAGNKPIAFIDLDGGEEKPSEALIPTGGFGLILTEIATETTTATVAVETTATTEVVVASVSAAPFIGGLIFIAGIITPHSAGKGSSYNLPLGNTFKELERSNRLKQLHQKFRYIANISDPEWNEYQQLLNSVISRIEHSIGYFAKPSEDEINGEDFFVTRILVDDGLANIKVIVDFEDKEAYFSGEIDVYRNGKKVGKGVDLIYTAVDYVETMYDVEVVSFKSVWKGNLADNLNAFNKAYKKHIANGLSEDDAKEAAAWDTHTGRWFKGRAWKKVYVETGEKDKNGDFIGVNAIFKKKN